MDLTKNYSLKKPLKTTNLRISDLNDNMDILDTKLKEVDEKAGNIDLSGLQTQIDSKADKTHKHAISDITNLQTNLNSIESILSTVQKKKITNDNGSAIYTIGKSLPTVSEGIYCCTATNAGAYAAPKGSVEGVLIVESNAYWNFIGFSDDGTMLTCCKQSTWKGWQVHSSDASINSLLDQKANQSEVNAHLGDDMPHKFVDGGKTYRWGFRTVNGEPQFIYEEVI